MTGRLDGDTAVVTGSSTGLGEGIARRFAEGASVVTDSRALEQVESTAGAIHAAVGSPRYLPSDPPV